MQIDQPTIDRLKAQNKGQDLFLVTVESKIEVLQDKDADEVSHRPVDELDFVFKKPDRKIMAAASKVGADNPMAAVDLMIKNCMLFGDEKSLDDVTIYAAVSMQFENIVKPRLARIKNL